MFDANTILITGGTGSFGKATVRTILERYQPRKLIIFSRDELKQFEMAQTFPVSPDGCVRYFLGDVRDEARLDEAFHGVDYVIHAAALKQVPACEYNPFEAVKTNVLGAQNVIRAAIRQRVKKVIALSTDKAANPVNLYGATKLCSDKLFVAGNAMSAAVGTRFSVVRYGNVLGSRGSVIPLFVGKRGGGVLTVTDERMTRFWITLQEAVDFVLRGFERMHGGELFVPKIPSCRIVDLARVIAPQARIEYIGIRPGEKLHEVLVPVDDARQAIEFDDHFVVQPDFSWWTQEDLLKQGGGRQCPDGYCYSSDTNHKWLTHEQIGELVRDYCREHAIEL